MDRHTYRDCDGRPALKINGTVYKDFPAVEAFYAYEDTCLTPEEVKSLADIKVFELRQLMDKLDMSIDGTLAKAFMAYLLGLFETAGATNFLTITVDHKDHHYGITIQKRDAELTPEEKISSLRAELDRAILERDTLEAIIGQCAKTLEIESKNESDNQNSMILYGAKNMLDAISSEWNMQKPKLQQQQPNRKEDGPDEIR